MNVDSVHLNQSTPLKAPNEPSKVCVPGELPISVLKRLDALSILSHEVFPSPSSKLKVVIEALNQPCIDYKKCKLLYIEAYIQDFNEKERNFFLTHFFEYFDPNKEIIQLSTLGFESKDFFWENVIRYLCESYMGFDANALPLIETFTFHLSEQEKSFFQQTEKDLENRFDAGVDLLRDFSGDITDPIKTKILFTSYLARLISNLEEIEQQNIETEDSEFSIESLFEELYFYLFHFPYSKGDHPTSNLFSLCREDLNLLDGIPLKKQIIKHLLDLLQENSFGEAELASLKEILGQAQFLDLKV